MQTAQALLRYGIRFIGAVKNATRKYPAEYLSKNELNNRADHVSMVSKGDLNSSELFALLGMVTERTFFDRSCSVVLPGEITEQTKWRNEGEFTRRVQFQVPYPMVAED